MLNETVRVLTNVFVDVSDPAHASEQSHTNLVSDAAF